MSTLREQLQAIYDEHGKLTPLLVVDEARDKKHPLHARFEWADKVAGEKWREHQASELIRSVKVVYRSGDKQEEVRYFQSVRREDGCVYEPSDKIAQDPLLTQIVLRDMEREWRQLQSRYGHFREFVELVRGSVELVRGSGEEAA